MKQKKPTAPVGVEAVERALAILLSFRVAGEQLPLAELAQRTGFYKSTILRLAASLERKGFMSRNSTGEFRLGREIPRLAALYVSPFDLEKIVRPILVDLVKTTRETAAFYELDGSERICRYRENSPRVIRHHLEEGARLPLNVGASGRILAAFSDINNPDHQMTREQGWYISLGERDPDAAAVAVPVMDLDGHLWGALSVSGLRSRFSSTLQKRTLAVLQAAAADLKLKLPEHMS